MNRKIILLLFCIITLVSCGKKGDPEYGSKKNIYDLIKHNKNYT